MVAIKIVKIRTRYQATVWSGLNLRETFQWNIDTNTSWWQQKALINGVSSYLSSVTLLLTGPIMTCDTWRAAFQSWSKHQLSLRHAELQQEASIKMLLPVHQVTSIFPHIRHEREEWPQIRSNRSEDDDNTHCRLVVTVMCAVMTAEG